MSFCVEAHSLLKYTHGPCEKFFSLCYHSTLKEILSLFTCSYFVFLLEHDKLDKQKAFMHKGFKLPSNLSRVKKQQKKKTAVDR